MQNRSGNPDSATPSTSSWTASTLGVCNAWSRLRNVRSSGPEQGSEFEIPAFTARAYTAADDPKTTSVLHVSALDSEHVAEPPAPGSAPVTTQGDLRWPTFTPIATLLDAAYSARRKQDCAAYIFLLGPQPRRRLLATFTRLLANAVTRAAARAPATERLRLSSAASSSTGTADAAPTAPRTDTQASRSGKRAAKSSQVSAATRPATAPPMTVKMRYRGTCSRSSDAIGID